MTALIIIGIIVLFFLLILFLPLRVRIAYTDSVNVYVPLLFFRIPLYPRKQKLKPMSAEEFRKSGLQKKSKKTKKPADKKATDNKSPEKLTIKSIKPHIGEIVNQVKALLIKFNGHLNAKIYSLRIVISSDDAAASAITYGAVSSTVSVLMGVLEDRCNIKYSKKARTGVYLDYTLGKCIFECDIRFTLKVWQIISLAVSAAIAFIKIKTNLEVKNNVREQNQ